MPNRLSCAETARRLNLSEFTLSRMRRENRGPAFVRLARNRVEYLEASVEAWLDERTTVPSNGHAA
jgi:predicted DNA-binding transcriptional regulator AlpA